MIKLIDLLNEIGLGEAIVKVPKEVLDKSKEAFELIKFNIQNLVNYTAQHHPNGDDVYVPDRFKNYFEFKDLKNKDIQVSIGFYYDPKDIGAGRMDTYNDILSINLAFFDSNDPERFEEIIEHELVHAMDPKVRNHKLYHTLYAKKGAEPDGEKSLEKYYKSPWEFDAFTAPLINNIKFNLDKLDESFKNEYTKLILQLLSDIKNKSTDQIISDKKYESLPWFFTKKEWDENNFDYVRSMYKYELDKMKTWSTKPTLYQRFIKRVAQEIS